MDESVTQVGPPARPPHFSIHLSGRTRINTVSSNTDYVINFENTRCRERFLFGKDPQNQTFNCFINGSGECNPGAPINASYENYVGQLKLTLRSTLTPNFVNTARVAFHRDIENNTDPTPVLSCNTSSSVYVIPLVNDGAPCLPLTHHGRTRRHR